MRKEHSGLLQPKSEDLTIESIETIVLLKDSHQAPLYQAGRCDGFCLTSAAREWRQ